MSQEFWRQWQALAALSPFGWNPGTGASPPGSAATGIGTFADSAERFAAAVRDFFERARQTHLSPGAQSGENTAGASAAERLGNHLREQFAGFFPPPWPTGAGAASPGGSAFAEAPALGLGREHWLRAQRGLQAWNRVSQAQGRLQRIWSDTLREAAAAFTSQLRSAQTEPLTAEAINELYDVWIDCAELAYARNAHGDEFCDALAEYVNASGQWRRESAAGVEEWAKLFDLPTRTEINSLTRRLRELEARLRAVEKNPEPDAAPEPATGRPRKTGPSATPRPSAKARTSAKARAPVNARASSRARTARSKRTP